MSKMIFEDELKQELIKAEVELIEFSFKVAVESAMKNFYEYLCRGLDEDRIVTSMNMEYRKFIIDLAKAIPEKLLPKAMPIILGI